jgi:hypothetical protein
MAYYRYQILSKSVLGSRDDLRAQTGPAYKPG